MRSLAKRVRGFAIVSAIFILVVLAALGAFIVTISTNQQIGSALDVQGVRAYQAARAGIEWGVFQVQSTAAYNFGYVSTNANLRKCTGGAAASTDSFNPGAATLAAFTVTVTCTETIDGSGGPSIYSITATACSEPIAGWTTTTTACPNTTNPGSLYIERRMSVAF